MKRAVLSCAALASIAVLSFHSPASATPVNYSESVSGDLSGFSPPLFTFDVGTNTISGTFGSVTTNDFDSFAFVLPAGDQLTAGNVTLTDAAGDISSSSWRVRSGSSSYDSGTLIETLSPNSPGSASLVNVPLGPNTYNVSQIGFSGPAGSSADYTFSFTVVPEPASLGVLALGAIALVRRRR